MRLASISLHTARRAPSTSSAGILRRGTVTWIAGSLDAVGHARGLIVSVAVCIDLQASRDFATLSGDFNPQHLDPVKARRLIFGGPVVHGIHLVLLGLDVALGA